MIPKVFNSEPRLKAFRDWQNKVVISNSFIGFDKSHFLPGNFVVSGPLVSAPDNLLHNLKQKHNDLWNWLEECTASKTPVIYLTLGSMCIWTEHEINCIIEGMKDVNCRIVWSISTPEIIPNREKLYPKYWISNWIP